MEHTHSLTHLYLCECVSVYLVCYHAHLAKVERLEEEEKNLPTCFNHPLELD